jgi:hypothetical protein
MIRYYAVSLCGLSAAVLAAVAWTVVPSDDRRSMLPQRDALELRPLGPSARLQQDSLASGLRAMARLESGEVLSGGSSTPALALPAPGSAVVDSVQMPRRSLSVFLESLSDERQVVSVDDRIVQAGSRLSEGGRITRVQPYQVTITEAQGRQRLDIGTERLEVGTLRWADGTPASVSTQAYRQSAPLQAAPAPVPGVATGRAEAVR